ncbi:Crp/Fnr family transcriptional regulator [Sphingomonas sp. M1-B02]|uniref:Crp/Fnr family transcriptional regulator n=1 Tax=Sphingomonas sp. M1-B02 TaxID=3114300 RepID=UPI0022409EB2|nr:Crp/Fnr family transcriptional regulator [Sphingomonas sp. S6-11]UZK64648.1 Crp/Fnr family transcriptional regulator [Sphingomonas sp. S6-11]
MKPDLRLFADRLTNRSRLSEVEVRAVLDLPARMLKVAARRDFVRLGETVDHVSVVAEGVVARFGQNSEGERQISAFHIAGDAPDLHTVVVPSDTVPLLALSEATILSIPHTALRVVAARYPAVAEAFWRDCSIDAAITANWVLNVGRRDAQTRIAHLLCEMAVRYNAHVGGGEVSYSFPLTQLQLADAVSMTSIHVNRSLRALAEQGLVTFSGGRVRIPDWKRLVHRGEFEDDYLQAGWQPGNRLRIMD